MDGTCLHCRRRLRRRRGHCQEPGKVHTATARLAKASPKSRQHHFGFCPVSKCCSLHLLVASMPSFIIVHIARVHFIHFWPGALLCMPDIIWFQREGEEKRQRPSSRRSIYAYFATTEIRTSFRVKQTSRDFLLQVFSNFRKYDTLPFPFGA